MRKNLMYKVLGKYIEAQTKGLGIEGLRGLQPPLHNYWGGLASLLYCIYIGTWISTYLVVQFHG